jgi:predicted phage tail protein
MVNVTLHGKMAKEFESSWKLDVSYAAEVLRALDVQIPNFRKFLTENELQGHRYWMAVNGKKLLKEGEFFCKLPKDAKTIDILPVVGGGAPLVPFLVKMLLFVAIGTAMGMIMSKIFEPPDPQELKDTNSYLFAGAANTESQGIPVPIAYGTLLVGGKVVSAVNEYSDLEVIEDAQEPWSAFKIGAFVNRAPVRYKPFEFRLFASSSAEGIRAAQEAGAITEISSPFSDIFTTQRGLGGE